jgi:tRNA pseudouridine38-40 synthase
MRPQVHLAVRIGYLGDAFHGSQVQPDVRTVQGELQRVLTSLGWWDPDHHLMVLGSRTDAGVHVRRNGGLLTLDRDLWEQTGARKVVRAIDDRLPEELRLLDVQEVSPSWNPRLALHRVYRYRLEGIEGWVCDDVDVFQRHLQHFVGTYDARNMARLEEGKDPVRTVLSATPWTVGGRVVGFEIVGLAFLWNQVRRTAMAVHGLQTGRLTEEEVRSAIDRPDLPADFGVAPAEWLVLWDVVWEDLDGPPPRVIDRLWAPPPNHAGGGERTMRRRWEAGARAEVAAMLQHEWSHLGRLPSP